MAKHEPLLNVNMQNLTERYGAEKAGEVFREIADLGGYGTVGNDKGNIDPNYVGGLGVLGALREDNTAISNEAKDRIAELAGIDRKKDIDNHKGVGTPRTNPTDTQEQ